MPSRQVRGSHTRADQSGDRWDAPPPLCYLCRMARPLCRLVSTALLIGGLFAAFYAHADNWISVATVSETISNTVNRVCVGGGRTDIGCPSNSLYLSTAGLVGIGTAAPSTELEVVGTISATTFTGDNLLAGGLTISGDAEMATISTSAVSVHGDVSATHFYGDGSGLTGITAASSDRITSGTTSMIAYTANGYVSVTQAGVNTAYFHPSRGLVAVGVSSTGGISGTTGYFGNDISIGAELGGARTLSLGNPTGGQTVPSSYAVANNAKLVFYSNDATENWTRYLDIVANGANAPSHIRFFTAGTTWTNPAVERVRITSGGRLGLATTTPSQTLHVSGTAITTSWTGINFSSAANVTPTAPLEVSGTVSATHFVGDGSGLTGLAASGDRITSGTAAVTAHGATNGVSVTTNMEVSGTVKVAGTGSEPCTSDNNGTLRIDPVTKRLQICKE
jgi:hypothetical protein